ncbi:flagellar hook-length control protein FliK [Salinisphaera sp.]|uniref:flagellar hook-length control protein FliK n=1 Tax=Salinisphaera sp. TaxID=1914330 RepID=UPI002D786E3A|nr:flagellar hook-length control protein FliK [Salinisphaera sp.]HET7312731.1 flagellar hook-length control protein FliK [Salinisphaera sp.]
MAIDLGALSGSAKSAPPTTDASTKTAKDGDTDFSRTLAASRASHERDSDAAPAGRPARDNKADAGQTTHSDAENRTRPHNKSAANAPRDDGKNPSTEKSADKPEDDAGRADLVRRRLSSVSLLAEQRSAETKQTGRAATTAHAKPPTESQARGSAAVEIAAQTPGNAAKGAAKHAADDGVATHTAAGKNKTPRGRADDTSDDRETGTPIAALIQAPLIATTTIKPGGPKTVSVDGSAHARPGAAGLHVSWQQLFARLDGNAQNAATGGQGQAQNQARQQAGGNDPAQLLAILTSNGKAGAAIPDGADGSARFSFVHGADTPSAAPNNAALPSGMTGHGVSASSHTASAAGANNTSATLAAPLASDDWNAALGQQTLRLSRSGRQQAQIQLHPRELGQINISVTVNHHNQAQVHFAAAHAHVRDAVEAALPQLRQALAAGGLSLGQASVGDQNSQAAFAHDDGQSERRSGERVAQAGTVVATATAPGASAPAPSGIGRPGGIDIFA